MVGKAWASRDAESIVSVLLRTSTPGATFFIESTFGLDRIIKKKQKWTQKLFSWMKAVI